MYQYHINSAFTPLEDFSTTEDCVLVLLTSEELSRGIALPGLEHILRHTPSPKNARMCKTEVRRDCLCATIVTPRHTRDMTPIAFGVLLAPGYVVLCDDTGAARSMVQHLRRENVPREWGIGGFFCEFLEMLTAKDLRHLQELEDRQSQVEDRVLAGQLEDLNPQMTALRKETASWLRYYAQLDEMICEFQENTNEYFNENELRMLYIVEKRIGRLKNEAQMLREYGLQVRELFQGEIDIRQNRIMKILTIVTTIFLPLSLVAGWYGMNFSNMPELTWKYGYLTVIAACALIVCICLWIMKRKKFW